MARRRIPAIAACVFATLAAAVTPARASIVERVVAVIGDRPILLSELRQRARPTLARIAAQSRNASEQAGAESEVFRELLNHMIDERLEEQAADKAHLSVSSEEIDAAIRTVAAQAKLTPADLIAEARRQGLSEQDYRDELRRQLLEGKLIQLRVRGRVRVTEQDARAAYSHFLKQASDEMPVELGIIVLQVPPGASQQTSNARMVLGEELSRRAKAGESFCTLVQSYSEDPTTKNTCGSRGTTSKSTLYPQLQQAAEQLAVGEISSPILFRDPMGNQAVLVVKVVSKQSQVPTYDEVKEPMMERAYMEATQRQQKLWLAELRRGIYIDVRL